MSGAISDPIGQYNLNITSKRIVQCKGIDYSGNRLTKESILCLVGVLLVLKRETVERERERERKRERERVGGLATVTLWET